MPRHKDYIPHGVIPAVLLPFQFVAQVDLVGRILHLRLAGETPLAPAALAVLVQSRRHVVPTPQGLKASLADGQDPLDGLAALFGLLRGAVSAGSSDHL